MKRGTTVSFVKPKKYPIRNRWRVIIPARFNDGKKRTQLFQTKDEANEAIKEILQRADASRLKITAADEATLTLAKEEGLSPQQMLEAIRLYIKQVLSVTKTSTLEEACVAFIKYQGMRSAQSALVWSDRQALRDKLIPALGAATPMTEITLDNIDGLHWEVSSGRHTQDLLYPDQKVFYLGMAQEGYTATNLMAGIKSEDKWNENTEKMDLETFRRLLFVTAGLEPIRPGEAPTSRFQRLLPRYVLGGLAGIRDCEIIPTDPADPVIDWKDILWNKNLIMVRHEVAKETKAKNRLRYPPLEPSAKEWLKLVARSEGPILDMSLTRYTQLHGELRRALGLKLPKNGYRNSYASYRLSIESPGKVSQAMGDTEETMKRWYTETLEPGDGHAWFNIRPGMDNKIIQMVA